MSEYCRNCFNLQEEVNHLEGVSDGYAVVEMQDKAKIRELEAKVAELEGENQKAFEKGHQLGARFGKTYKENELSRARLEGQREGWDAGRIAKNGCVIGMDYNEGNGPRYPRFDDWQKSKSESLKDGEGNEA